MEGDAKIRCVSAAVSEELLFGPLQANEIHLHLDHWLVRLRASRLGNCADDSENQDPHDDHQHGEPACPSRRHGIVRWGVDGDIVGRPVKRLQTYQPWNFVTRGVFLLSMLPTHLLLAALVAAGLPEHAAKVEGEVHDATAPIEGARIDLVGTQYTTVTGHDGHFSLGVVTAGEYTLRVMRIGYRPLVVLHFKVADEGDTPPLSLVLERAPVPLAAVVVTPGYFGIMQPSVATPHTLTRQDIETVPQIGEDIYRAITRLPGVTADDFSAKFSVRGATGDALYVTLDGLALTEPFHLKDIGGALSIIDIQALGGAELTTGGPGAEYGEQLAGVFAMHSREPRTDRARTSLGLSLMNARVMSDGGFANGKGGWLVSARRGYIDIALKIVSPGDSLQPRYYDVFGKVQYDFGRAGKVALHRLIAGDNLHYQDSPDSKIESKYGSAYTWFIWEADVGSRLKQQTVASVGQLDWRRLGGTQGNQATPISLVDDTRSMTLLNLRQDWTVALGLRSMLKVGFDAGHQSIDYAYASHFLRSFVDPGGSIIRTTADSITVGLSPSGNRLGAYVAQRFRVVDALTIEGGLRYDNGQQRGGPQIGPRFNAAWEPRRGTAVRGAWGLYSQAHPLFGLQVEDGESQFYQAEHAEQRVIGIEQSLPRSMSARIEAYDRLVSNPRPRHVSVSGDINMLPELEWDRVLVAPRSARARGIEASVGREGAAHVDWSANYILSSSTIDLGGAAVPQQMDQRHAVRLDWAFHPVSNRWRLAVASQWHSGWPATPVILKVDTLSSTATSTSVFVTPIPGSFDSERLSGYSRVDARWTRFFETRHGRVSFFAEVFNLFNSHNTRGEFATLRVNNGKIVSGKSTNDMLPRLPSIGITWEF